MDLTFSVEQRLLRDAVTAFLANAYDFERRKKTLAEAPHWRADIWKAVAQDLGLLGAAVPERLGGLGGGAIEHMIIMEEFGRALVVEPYVGTAVIGGGLLARDGAVKDAAALAQQMIEGQVRFALAQAEEGSRFSLSSVATMARRTGKGWTLSGRKKVVLGAPLATHFIVTARSAGEQRDRRGVSLFLVPAESPGILVRDYLLFDGQLAGDATFDAVAVGPDALIGDAGEGLPLVEAVMDAATAAICAEAVGVLQTMLESTVAYTRERRQFGAPLSTFQTLQHRMADMFIEVEQARSVALMAAIRIGEQDSLRRRRAVSLAKVQVSDACRKVGQAAIQLHGGMGMTDEMAISHYFKRATMIGTQFGAADHHLRRIEQIDDAMAAA